MKILYVTTISNMVNAFLVPHIEYLIDHGHEVGVAFNLIQAVKPKLINLGCKVYDVPFQRDPFKKENIRAYRQLKRIVLDEGYQLIHVHSPIASFITRFACRNIRDVRVLYTAHGFHFFKGAPRKNWAIYYTLEKIASRWTDGIITMNNEDYALAQKLKLRNNSDRIYKVHGVGLDLKRFKPQTVKEKSQLRREYNISNEECVIIYVGELCYRKHQDLLIKAVGKVSEKISSIRLLLVGDGAEADTYRALVKSLGIERNVEFLGFRNDVDKLMTISDFTISTSRQEGLPVNVMEGMATGLPIIVTNCRGNRDLVSNGVNGFVTDMEAVEECANAIELLYHSKELREQFARKNTELIQDYSLENVINEMSEVYSDFTFLLPKNSKLWKRNNERTIPSATRKP